MSYQPNLSNQPLQATGFHYLVINLFENGQRWPVRIYYNFMTDKMDELTTKVIKLPLQAAGFHYLAINFSENGQRWAVRKFYIFIDQKGVRWIINYQPIVLFNK